MKRKDKHWSEKVDPVAVTYLKVYREARSLASKVPMSGDLIAYFRALEPAREVFRQHPEISEERKVSLQSDFIDSLQTAFGEIFEDLRDGDIESKRIVDILEMAQTLAKFDSLPPEVKTTIYFFMAAVIVPTWSDLVYMKRQQYGEKPLDLTKIKTLAAQQFGNCPRFS